MDAQKGPHTYPHSEVRDERGWVVDPGDWTDEQRAQWRVAITAQFREGEQLPDLQAVRDELAIRMKWVEDWDHHKALKDWTLRQMDGLIAGDKG